MKKQLLAASMVLAAISSVGSAFATVNNTPVGTPQTAALTFTVPATATVNFTGSNLTHSATAAEVLSGNAVGALTVAINTQTNVANTQLFVETGNALDNSTNHFTLTSAGGQTLTATPTNSGAAPTHSFSNSGLLLIFDGNNSHVAVNPIATGTDSYQGSYDVTGLATAIPGTYNVTLTANLFTP